MIAVTSADAYASWYIAALQPSSLPSQADQLLRGSVPYSTRGALQKACQDLPTTTSGKCPKPLQHVAAPDRTANLVQATIQMHARLSYDHPLTFALLEADAYLRGTTNNSTCTCLRPSLCWISPAEGTCEKVGQMCKRHVPLVELEVCSARPTSTWPRCQFQHCCAGVLLEAARSSSPLQPGSSTSAVDPADFNHREPVPARHKRRCDPLPPPF
jgi:hypothetical protein